MKNDFVTKCRSMLRNVGKIKPKTKSTIPPSLEVFMEKKEKKLAKDSASQGHEQHVFINATSVILTCQMRKDILLRNVGQCSEM